MQMQINMQSASVTLSKILSDSGTCFMTCYMILIKV